MARSARLPREPHAVVFPAGGPETRVMFILGGLVSIAFGAVLCARPGIGAITLALLFGLFNLTYGTWAPVHCIELRRNRETGRCSGPPAAALAISQTACA